MSIFGCTFHELGVQESEKSHMNIINRMNANIMTAPFITKSNEVITRKHHLQVSIGQTAAQFRSY
jgi:hypothetical protein